MTIEHRPAVPDVTDSDLFLSRTFDAPREAVWRYFVDPAALALWFGPRGVHVDPASVVVDLREGGRWDLDMIDDASGDRYPLRCRITAFRPEEYLEGAMTGADGAIAVTLRLWFHDHGERTRLTLHQGPFTAEQLTQTGSGWTESFEKIDAALAAGEDAR
ncbi:SRPBCC domain-containing protein [Herbiconiux sp. L3-i23]|uniref:SRPBCC family protein n=1 Tax=Herbiconiux sp. L3-i23 TaxID=2905871 RepID=UPI0020486C59|nr:SRPBCC domain-containing protein [Herbiconiux sp. L3-i23]BDI23938.1 activator of HSP90 ATPase [Herbiconiux sp. L3-i23]